MNYDFYENNILIFHFVYQVEPSFLLGFLDSSIESLKLSKEEELNGIIGRLELIDKLEIKKKQIALSVKVLESDAESMFDNECHYVGNGSVKSRDSVIATKYVTDMSKHDDYPNLSKPSTLVSPHSPQQQQQHFPFKQEQNHIAQHSAAPIVTPISFTPIATTPATPCKVEDVTSPTGLCSIAAGHDNSFTSDPSETTNTISDDATVISKVEYIEEKSEEISSASISQENHHSNPTNASNPVTSKTKAIETNDSSSEHNKIGNCSKKLTVDASEVYQIIDSIRQTTSLSHKLSCVAVRVVLSELEAIYSTKILHFLEPIATHLVVPLNAPDEFIEHTHDSQRLKIIFSQLADCKNDSEQRTWILHEDEQYITKFLTELIEILVIP